MWGGVLAESDSESAPSWTPTKVPKEKDSLHVKTLEEIRLERIQAESAAYWEGIAGGPMAWEAANPAANPSAILCASTPSSRKPCASSSHNFKKSTVPLKTLTKDVDFRVLSLDEIRRNRARRLETCNELQGQRPAHSFNTRFLSNGHPEDNQSAGDSKNIGVTDLRIKLANAKSSNSSGMSSLKDTSCGKRQYEDTSPKSSPHKRQRIKLHTLSDLKVERILETNTLVNNFCDDDVDGHILNDIDQLLMK